MTPTWLRLGAALGLSALLHGVVLLLMRSPSPPASGDVRMNVLIVPLQPAAPQASSAAAAAKPAAQKEPGRNSAAVAVAPTRPSPVEPAAARRASALITAGPISPPPALPSSGLADAASYVDAGRLPSYPRLSGELAARYPRQALEQRRSAVVVLQLMIDEDGKVVEALAVPGAGEDFTAAALEALRGARFAPGETASAKPVRSRAYFAVSFVIE